MANALLIAVCTATVVATLSGNVAFVIVGIVVGGLVLRFTSAGRKPERR